jgi:tetraacyldisaccharide 4'-kinase
MSKARLSLFPLSVIYDGVTRIKNFLYDKDILKSNKFQIPLIVIGNLSVGGTGKTPHTELVASLVKDIFKTAVLSRGYGRKTSGYFLANQNSTSQEIGDEPLQIFNTISDIDVAVCEDRTTGVQNLLESVNPEVVILDDAFQHRKIQGSLYILLTTFQKLFTEDFILPAGNLRESASNKERANVIIVTKCPVNLSRTERKKIIEKINPSALQKVFFSYIQYSKPKPFADTKNWNNPKTALLVTGIVNPNPLATHLQSLGCAVKQLNFPDHYDYTQNDIKKIKTEIQLLGKNTVLVTTSKDAVKLKVLFNKIDINAFEIPIKVGFLFDQENEFKNIILEHVRKI